MPFERASLSELVDRVLGDIRGRLEIDSPLLSRAMADVVGAVWAGAVHLLYGYLDWLARQLFGDTSEREQLLRQAALYGITPVAATFASGAAIATGVNGTSILAGEIVKLDAAVRYRVTTGQVIAGGTATLPIDALLAGEDANVPDGTVLTFENPILGVNPTAEVDGDITNGVDEEGTEELRDRYLLRKRRPPQGGAEQDYEAWALAVAGVTRAWVYEHELGLGTVVVRFVRDGDPDIFPDAGAVAAVQAAEDERRPITAVVTALAPVELAVAFTIGLTPDNADTRAAVTAELVDLLRREAAPGDGAGFGTIRFSKIYTAIGIAAGVEDFVLTVPLADVVPGVGELATVGVITWV